MLKNKIYLIWFALSLPAISIVGIYVDGSVISENVKNNAKLWTEVNIGESDYSSSLQYLVSQGILSNPITEVTAAKSSLTDSESAQSFVVTFSNGDFFPQPETFYTFSRFEHISTTTTDLTLEAYRSRESSPSFILSSLPSEDKGNIYKLVNSFINPGRVAVPFNVKIDILSGNGNELISYRYAKCSVTDFIVYLEQSKEIYRFSDRDNSEIRDIIVFKCSGFRLN